MFKYSRVYFTFTRRWKLFSSEIPFIQQLTRHRQHRVSEMWKWKLNTFSDSKSKVSVFISVKKKWGNIEIVWKLLSREKFNFDEFFMTVEIEIFVNMENYADWTTVENSLLNLSLFHLNSSSIVVRKSVNDWKSTQRLTKTKLKLKWKPSKGKQTFVCYVHFQFGSLFISFWCWKNFALNNKRDIQHTSLLILLLQAGKCHRLNFFHSQNP